MKRDVVWLTLAMIASLAVAPAARAQCPSSEPTCSEHTGAGKKGSFFRISVPNTPAWNGDVVLVNHGFELNDQTITGHNTCRIGGTACMADIDCPIMDDVCNKITFFGLDEVLLPQGIAVAASTYSQTGWAVFESRKDLNDILKFMKKEPAIGKPARVFVTGFSMGGAVTIDYSLRSNPKRINGIAPLCPAAAGGLPSWDAATDVRMAYDYVCDGVGGGQFFSPVDQSGPVPPAEFPSLIGLGLKFDACMGVILGDPDVDQQARLDEFRALLQHTGTDEEMAVLVGFATQGMFDTVQPRKKLKGKGIAYNPSASVVYSDPTFDAAVERFETPGKGRKKLNKNYYPDFTKGKGSKIEYPIVTLANNDDFLTTPGMQQIYRDALTEGGIAFTQVFVNGGSHCNFSEFEVTAAVQAMLDWADTGTQPTESDIETLCLGLPGATAGDCDFDIGFVPPPFTDRVPARPDWPPAAQ